MTKIEKIQSRRRERLMSLSKEALVKKIMNATVFSDTYFLIKDDIVMEASGLENTIKSMHNSLN